MERSAWTDERLDDRFDHVDSELGALRAEMREGFAQVRGEMAAMRSELGGEISELRSELRLVMVRIGGGIIVGLVGVIAAILARGV